MFQTSSKRVVFQKWTFGEAAMSTEEIDYLKRKNDALRPKLEHFGANVWSF